MTSRESSVEQEAEPFCYVVATYWRRAGRSQLIALSAHETHAEAEAAADTDSADFAQIIPVWASPPVLLSAVSPARAPNPDLEALYPLVRSDVQALRRAVLPLYEVLEEPAARELMGCVEPVIAEVHALRIRLDASPARAPTCKNCRAPLDPGEAETFTLCEKCWGELHIPPDTAHVLIATALVKELASGEWSNPVRARVTRAEGMQLWLEFERADSARAPARSDTERLDWLASEASKRGPVESYGVESPPLVAAIAYDASHTLREAIDAARASHPEPSTPEQK